MPNGKIYPSVQFTETKANIFTILIGIDGLPSYISATKSTKAIEQESVYIIVYQQEISSLEKTSYSDYLNGKMIVYQPVGKFDRFKNI